MKQERISIEYGGAFQRFIATLLDSLILLPVSAIMVGLTEGGFTGIVLNLAVHMAYYVGFLNGSWRATPGKRVMKLYVVNTQGVGALGKEQAALRFIAYHIPVLPLYASFIEGRAAELAMLLLFTVWFTPILMTRERMGVHDMLCNTRVMRGEM